LSLDGSDQVVHIQLWIPAPLLPSRPVHVIPAKAGIQGFQLYAALDPGFRRDDEKKGQVLLRNRSMRPQLVNANELTHSAIVSVILVKAKLRGPEFPRPQWFEALDPGLGRDDERGAG